MLTIYRLSTKLKKHSFDLCTKLSKLVTLRETHVSRVMHRATTNGHLGSDDANQGNKYGDYVKFLELVGNLKVIILFMCFIVIVNSL